MCVIITFMFIKEQAWSNETYTLRESKKLEGYRYSYLMKNVDERFGKW